VIYVTDPLGYVIRTAKKTSSLSKRPKCLLGRDFGTVKICRSKGTNMNTPQTPSGQWRKQKAKLKLMFSQLTDNDFKYDYGMKEVMMRNLQEKIGKTRSELNGLMLDYNEKKYYN
jgi:hypothetical protein